MNILFICSENRLRSRTAETIWSKHPGLAVRSAGINPSAVYTVQEDDIQWADAIFVMEQEHQTFLKGQYPDVLNGKLLHILYIPDIYPYMDPILIQILEVSIPDCLEFLRQS